MYITNFERYCQVGVEVEVITAIPSTMYKITCGPAKIITQVCDLCQ